MAEKIEARSNTIHVRTESIARSKVNSLYQSAYVPAYLSFVQTNQSSNRSSNHCMYILSVYLSIYLSVCLPIYLPTYLSIPSIQAIPPSFPSIQSFLSFLSILSTIYLSVYLFTCLSACPSIYLSIKLAVMHVDSCIHIYIYMEIFFGEGEFTRHVFRYGRQPRLPGYQLGRFAASLWGHAARWSQASLVLFRCHSGNQSGLVRTGLFLLLATLGLPFFQVIPMLVRFRNKSPLMDYAAPKRLE